MAETCFIMQPFDGGTFDKRYKDVFGPAIINAGLEPYRVDQDPKVSIPIQDIERGIREAKICFAEITLDNPNVWFELGFAFASGKEVVLVCSDERITKFPFDIQHRTIIKYSTASSSDFERLKVDITTKIKAYFEKAETLSDISELAKLNKVEGLDAHEVVALIVIGQNLEYPSDNVSMYQIRRDMDASGYTKVAANIALKVLLQKGFVSFDTYNDPQDGEPYIGYSLSDEGWNWVLENKEKFNLQKDPMEPRPKARLELPPEDDIPF